MSERPRVSICIPTRNQSQFLAQCLRSALAQDVDGLEVVVHDDASCDDTASVVAAAGDERVRYRRHAAPVGVAANRNSCLADARGESIAWLDSDDERLPGTLSAQLAVLDAEPAVVLVHGGIIVVDEDGRRLPDWPAPFAADTIEPAARAFVQLVAANELTTSTVVVRRWALDAAGPFAGEIGASSTDWDMWLRIAQRGDVAYLARPVARYRQHAETISRGTSRSGQRLRCNARVLARVLRGASAEISVLARAALAAQAVLHAGDAYTSGDRDEARAAIALAAEQVSDTGLGGLAAAIDRGDDGACMRLTRSALGRLADPLAGTRFGDRVRRVAAGDPAWAAQLDHAGSAAARVTPDDAVLAAIAKWDPTLLDAAGRPGCNFPDRILHPEGYPRDGAGAVAHLEQLRALRGVTHVVVPGFSAWWLDHYPEFARRLGPPVWHDRDCAIYAA